MRFIKIMALENELIGLDFLKHFRSTFPHAVDFDGSVMRAFNATSWPNAVIIDKDGKVAAHEYVAEGGIGVLEKALEKVTEDTPYTAGSSINRFRAFCRGGICYSPAPGTASKLPETRRDFPRTAAAPDGSIYIAFTSNETGDNNIFVEIYKRGRMKKRFQITSGPSDEYDSDIAVADDGRVWLAWASNADSLYDIYAASLSGGELSQAERVTRTKADAFHPRIAVDSFGNPCVAFYKWIEKDGSTTDRNIYMSRKKNGRWMEAVEVSPPKPEMDDHSDPDIASSRDGIAVAWSYDYHPTLEGNTLDAASPSVFVQRFSGDFAKAGGIEFLGTKGKDKHIKDISPSIAWHGRNAACAWDAMKSIMMRRYEKDGWRDVEKISSGAGPCNAPSVAVNAGRIYTAYSQLVDGRWKIVGRVFEKGMWRPEKILSRGGGDSRFPSVVIDKRGGVWVAYSQSTRGGVGIRLRKW